MLLEHDPARLEILDQFIQPFLEGADQVIEEINASIARVAYHRARNAEINASIARVAAQRAKAFEEARNAEIVQLRLCMGSSDFHSTWSTGILRRLASAER